MSEQHRVLNSALREHFSDSNGFLLEAVCDVIHGQTLFWQFSNKDMRKWQENFLLLNIMKKEMKSV